MRLGITATVLVLLMTTPTLAAGDGSNVEITPFVGYHMGGRLDIDPEDGPSQTLDIKEAASVGLILAFPVGGLGGAIDVMYIRQDTDLDSDPIAGSGESDFLVEYIHAGGSYSFRQDSIRPFVAASLGMTRLEATGFDSESRFSVSAGGGIQIRPWQHLGFRFEGRWYGILVDRDEEELCADDDEDFCLSYIDNSVQSQWDVKGGLVIAF